MSLMSLLPIFMVGLIVGIIFSYVWYMYKKDTPSEVRLKILEAENIKYKSDIKMYHDLTNKLYVKINKLENNK